mmetsp:Transcript_82101/g.232467  ORF Transcript_82101/g.232467 Transcript_82101/m.232467 type:complete len:217 (-) Transcript_82101:52-702(-)
MKAEHEHVVAIARPGDLALHYLVAHHHATTPAAEQRIRDPRDGIAHGAQHVEELVVHGRPQRELGWRHFSHVQPLYHRIDKEPEEVGAATEHEESIAVVVRAMLGRERGGGVGVEPIEEQLGRGRKLGRRPVALVGRVSGVLVEDLHHVPHHRRHSVELLVEGLQQGRLLPVVRELGAAPRLAPELALAQEAHVRRHGCRADGAVGCLRQQPEHRS